jgi:predicted dehydrogenase
MDGLWSRFFPAWEFAKHILDSGELGKVVAINSITSWGAMPDNPKTRLFNLDMAGGALLDGGIYSLAAISVILGADAYPASIKALTEIGSTKVDDRDGAVLRYASGVIATVLCGLQGPMLVTNVLCENGSLTIPNHRNPSSVEIRGRNPYNGYRGPETRNYQFPYSNEGFQFEAKHVHDCIREGLAESPRVTKKESLALIRISDEIRRQAGFKYPFE